MLGVYKALLNGLYTRGEGGFLYVKGDECAYMFPNELNNENARPMITELVCGEHGCRMFYVLEERDNQLHLYAHGREEVFRSVADEEGESRG